MTNFYEETVNVIKDIGKTLDDVVYVSVCDGKYYKPEKFFEQIKDVEYDAGYGIQEINPNIKIVFRDGFLERNEYDGSEWWRFVKPEPVDVELEDFPDGFKFKTDW